MDIVYTVAKQERLLFKMSWPLELCQGLRLSPLD